VAKSQIPNKTATHFSNMKPTLCSFAILIVTASAAAPIAANAQESAPAKTQPKVARAVSPSSPIIKPEVPKSRALNVGVGKSVPESEPIPTHDPKKIAKSPQDLSNYPQRYRDLLAQAMSSFHSRDFKGAITMIDKADALVPPSPWSLNMRGAVAIELQQWDEGIKACTTALRIAPDFFPAKFNLCEIPFYQGRYAEARSLWDKLLTQQPKDELIIYRIFLTYLLEGDVLNADVWLKKIPFPSETPAYQYAHAALYFHTKKRAEENNDTAAAKKATSQAEEWLRSAEFIWPEQKRANFVDVLMQLGWVKRNELPTE
jgi:tetratricopeptide (TPR) repeat protein